MEVGLDFCSHVEQIVLRAGSFTQPVHCMHCMLLEFSLPAMSWPHERATYITTSIRGWTLHMYCVVLLCALLVRKVMLSDTHYDVFDAQLDATVRSAALERVNKITDKFGTLYDMLADCRTNKRWFTNVSRGPIYIYREREREASCRGPNLESLVVILQSLRWFKVYSITLVDLVWTTEGKLKSFKVNLITLITLLGQINVN